MRRLALFAHYDGHNKVKPYVQFLLASIRQECDQVTFVSTSDLPAQELDTVRAWCSDVLLRENTGFDFGMWKYALGRTRLSDWDEVLLVNSSVFGPIQPLAPIFRRMGQSRCDFWSMSSSFELDWHLQSYFLVFKRRVLHSAAFRSFWDSVLPYANKRQVIRSYEVGLSAYLSEQGFKAEAAVPYESLWSKPRFERLLAKRRTSNPTCHEPERLLDHGMPFVKVELLRDNPCRVPIRPVLQAMTRAGYPMDLIAFDRTPTPKRSPGELVLESWDRLRSCRWRSGRGHE